MSDIIDDDLLNVKKYPKVMYLDVYGNGTQSFEQTSKENGSIFDVFHKVKYVRIDLAIEKSHKDVSNALDTFTNIKHEEIYRDVSALLFMINNAGWQDKRSEIIDFLNTMRVKYECKE